MGLRGGPAPAEHGHCGSVPGRDVFTTDGPYAEGKEHIGGFMVIRAPDLDSALEWGGKLSRATTLPIEVRPLQDDTQG